VGVPVVDPPARRRRDRPPPVGRARRTARRPGRGRRDRLRRGPGRVRRAGARGVDPYRVDRRRLRPPRPVRVR
jgi:hypothetical protein